MFNATIARPFELFSNTRRILDTYAQFSQLSRTIVPRTLNDVFANVFTTRFGRPKSLKMKIKTNEHRAPPKSWPTTVAQTFHAKSENLHGRSRKLPTSKLYWYRGNRCVSNSGIRGHGMKTSPQYNGHI